MSDPAATEREATDLAAVWPAALLTAVGVAALMHVLVILAQALLPVWTPSPLLPLLFFIIAGFAFYRHRLIRAYRPYGGRMSIYLAEAIALLLLTRLVTLLSDPASIPARLAQWWVDPASFFDGLFVLHALLGGVAWLLGHLLGGAVDRLRLQPGELPPPRGSSERANWERSQAPFDHRGAYHELTLFVIGGGVVVVAALGLLSFALTLGPAPVAEAIVAAGIYLVCGLLMLAWAHVTLLDALWQIDGLTMPSLLRRRWAGWLALILVAVAVVALLAPRSYALDPIAVIVGLIQLIVLLFQLILFVIALPFLWLMSLFSGGQTPSPPSSPPAMPPIGAAPQEGEPSWLATARSLGFWLITLALAIYAARTLFRSRWGNLRLLPRIRLWSVLVRFWQALIGGLRERAGTLAAALRAGSARATVTAALRRPERTPRPTDPRALVQFLYLSLVERAGRRGYTRRRGMTAAEYSRYLAVRLLERPAQGQAPADPAAAQAELDLLTAAFLEARYSPHPVGDPEASRARRAFQQLLAVIRGARRRA